jgi:hypothetical protein
MNINSILSYSSGNQQLSQTFLDFASLNLVSWLGIIEGFAWKIHEVLIAKLLNEEWCWKYVEACFVIKCFSCSVSQSSVDSMTFQKNQRWHFKSLKWIHENLCSVTVQKGYHAVVGIFWTLLLLFLHRISLKKPMKLTEEVDETLFILSSHRERSLLVFWEQPYSTTRSNRKKLENFQFFRIYGTSQSTITACGMFRLSHKGHFWLLTLSVALAINLKTFSARIMMTRHSRSLWEESPG